MSPVTRNVIAIPAGYASQEVASLVAHLDDQLQRQKERTRTLTPADLEWQPAPGMNTIGMLMAHQAIVEVGWTGIGIEDLQLNEIRFQEILAIGDKDDGMPLAPNGAPPAGLAGKDLAFFDDLLDRARKQSKRLAVGVKDSELTMIRSRKRSNGELRELEVRWILYYMLEHFAGHCGQILLLQHARQALGVGNAAGR